MKIVIRDCACLLGQRFQRGCVYGAAYVDVNRSRVPGSGRDARYPGHLLVVGRCSRRWWRRRRGIRHCGRRGRRTAWRQQSDRYTFDISRRQALFHLRGSEVYASMLRYSCSLTKDRPNFSTVVSVLYFFIPHLLVHSRPLA